MKDQRGFTIFGKLQDERGVEAYVKQSSLATKKRTWLFVDDSNSLYTAPVKLNGEIGLHLSDADIRKLIKVLNKALES